MGAAGGARGGGVRQRHRVEAEHTDGALSGDDGALVARLAQVEEREDGLFAGDFEDALAGGGGGPQGGRRRFWQRDFQLLAALHGAVAAVEGFERHHERAALFAAAQGVTRAPDSAIGGVEIGVVESRDAPFLQPKCAQGFQALQFLEDLLRGDGIFGFDFHGLIIPHPSRAGKRAVRECVHEYTNGCQTR